LAARHPTNVNDHVSTTAAGILHTIADTSVSLGSNVGWYFSQSQLLIVFGPEHAATVQGDASAGRTSSASSSSRRGCRSGRSSSAHVGDPGLAALDERRDRRRGAAPPGPVAEDVYVIVAGGPGKHSAVVPNCTFSRAVSRPITGVDA